MRNPKFEDKRNVTGRHVDVQIVPADLCPAQYNFAWAIRIAYGSEHGLRPIVWCIAPRNNLIIFRM